MLFIAGVRFVATPGSIIFYESLLRDILFPVLTPEAGGIAPAEVRSSTESRFPKMERSLLVFAGIILIIWIESFFEELQDRVFSLNRFKALLSKIPFSIVFAVIAQAGVFGCRHASTHGMSGSIVVGIIGLIFSLIYVVSGRNLWPLIVVHCLLNTISMWDKICFSESKHYYK